MEKVFEKSLIVVYTELFGEELIQEVLKEPKEPPLRPTESTEKSLGTVLNDKERFWFTLNDNISLHTAEKGLIVRSFYEVQLLMERHRAVSELFWNFVRSNHRESHGKDIGIRAGWILVERPE